MTNNSQTRDGVAEGIYASINTEADIRQLLNNEEAERLHLDFKRRPQPGDMHKLLGRALSGFANADGGVLIFGVGESKGKLELQLVDDLAVFERQVNELLKRVVSFPVHGVQVKRVPTAATTGFLAVLIPRSELAPHQAVETKQYYRRHGDSFSPMEHYEIADAFGRRHQPLVVVQHPWRRLADKSDGGKRHVYRMNFSLENQGRGMALHYGFDVKMLRELLKGAAFPTSRSDREHEYLSYRSTAGRPLYPGETLSLPEVFIEYAVTNIEYAVTNDEHWGINEDAIAMEITTYGDNAPTRTESLTFQSVNEF